jgi:3-methyl-2-oxobutanoate hydroxymethyltransferase
MTSPPGPQPAPVKRVTVLDLAAARRAGRPISMITAYDWPTGRLADAAGVDCVLVGDSVAMVVAGRSSTIPATLEQMIYHGEIVSRAVTRARRMRVGGKP